MQQHALWRNGVRSALFVAVLIFVLGTATLAVVRSFIDWPANEEIGSILLIVLLVSLIPLALVLLEFLARQRAVLDLRGILKIDLSRGEGGPEVVRRRPVVLPANMGRTGSIVSDTNAMDILEALRSSARSNLVVVDIETGNAWWVTRLLALVAGAVRRGSPSVVVFIGRQANRDSRFLGWATPRDVLEAILEDREEYRERYKEAQSLAAQFLALSSNPRLDITPQPHTGVWRYLDDPRYAQLGEDAPEQILMDQLGSIMAAGGSLEEPPDKLTLARLSQLFERDLVREKVEAEWSGEMQVEAVLKAREDYIALVRDDAFDSLIVVSQAERFILRRIFAEMRETASA